MCANVIRRATANCGKSPVLFRLFAERERLLLEESFAGAAPSRNEGPLPKVGLLRASLNLEFLPLWSAFLRELGYEPAISPATTAALLYQNMPNLPAEVCLPIKAAAAQAKALLAAGIEKLFVPALLECPAREEDEAHTCFYAQQLPTCCALRFQAASSLPFSRCARACWARWVRCSPWRGHWTGLWRPWPVRWSAPEWRKRVSWRPASGWDGKPWPPPLAEPSWSWGVLTTPTTRS